jgi:hypothetical protein
MAPETYARENCAAWYHHNLPVFGLALHILTGDILGEASGA